MSGRDYALVLLVCVVWAFNFIAGAKGMDVRVFEPDVSPLAIQGPKSFDVVADLCGDWIRDLRYFGFRQFDLCFF